MNTRTLANRLKKMEVRFEPPKGPQFIRVNYVASDGRVTGSSVVRIGNTNAPLPPELEGLAMQGSR